MTVISQDDIRAQYSVFSVDTPKISVTLRGLTFERLVAGQRPAAVDGYQSSVSIDQCVFRHNNGQLIRCGLASDLRLSNSLVYENNGTNSLLAVSSASFFVSNSSIYDNKVVSLFEGRELAAIALQNVTIARNLVLESGMVWTRDSSGRQTKSTMYHCLFENNQVEKQLVAMSNADITIQNCTFQRNFHNVGPSLAITDSRLTADRILFLNNTGIVSVDLRVMSGSAILHQVHVEGSNSGPLNFSTSIELSGASTELETVSFVDCFRDRGSTGRLLIISSPSVLGTVVSIHNLSIHSCGQESDSQDRLVSLRAENNMNVTLSEAIFSNCRVSSQGNTLALESEINSTIAIDRVSFYNCSRALYGTGAMQMKNVNFTGSGSSDDSSGTALRLSGGKQSIENCYIGHHTRTAVELTRTESNFFECFFFNNSAIEEGGAVSVTKSFASFTGCHFETNRARQDGGALYSSESQLVLQSSTFLNNTSVGQNGGAVAMENKNNAQIDNCTFISNFGSYGGAIILLDTSQMNMNQGHLERNKALQAGGAIYIQNQLPFSTTITNSTIILNVCLRGSGGGMALGFLSSPLIFNCSFLLNSAISGGGIAITESSEPEIVSSTFGQNTASSSGGGIMIQGISKPLISKCQVIENKANSTGGGIVIKDISSPTILFTEIASNSSPNEGGGIVFTDKSHSVLKNCTIYKNQSGGGGGGFSFSITACGEFTGCELRDNVGLSSGGGVSFINSCTPSFKECRFIHNTASEGGGVSMEDTAHPIYFECLFQQNIAYSHGGAAVVTDYSSSSFRNCTFKDNLANNGRGGVMKIDDFADALFEDCEFINNRAAMGGALYASSQRGPVISRALFSDNRARIRGGALLFAGSSLGNLRDIIMEGNSAGESGGALHIQDRSQPSFLNATFTHNEVYFGSDGVGEGGAFTVEGSASPSFLNCTVAFNRGVAGGGASFHELTQSSLDNVLFSNNEAIRGGALYYRGFLDKMQNITILENFAHQFGGGMYMEATVSSYNQSICTHCTFFNNTATVYGGGLYLRSLVDISSFTELGMALPEERQSNSSSDGFPIRLAYSFDSPVFLGNFAQRGAGLFSTGGVALINFGPSCLFDDNTASEFGGGMFINQYQLAEIRFPMLYQATFQRNNAHFGGTNVAWNVVSKETVGDFCYNCSYGEASASFSGYQTREGFATAPTQLIIPQKCPTTLKVSPSNFTITTILEDFFGTPVTGTIDLENNVTVSVAAFGNCALKASSYREEVDPNSALSHFDNLSIEGTNQQSCQLIFSVPRSPNLLIPPTSCNISIFGCPDNQIVQLNEETGFDVCVQDSEEGNWVSGNVIIILSLIVLLLLCFIVAVIGCGSYKVIRKRYVKFILKRIEIPDLERKPTVSLDSVLNDPEIPHIPWEELIILDRIGMGANGIVSRGVWRPKGKRLKKVEIALKELLVEQEELLNPVVLEEFLIEIKFLSKLNHANVVKFLGISSPTGTTKLYLITELMHFGSLRDVLDRNSTLPWALRLKLAKDAAKGMSYLHKRKLIHRDLKSQNLLVNETWTCKIADFGISTVKEAQTRTMTCIGTPTYMAPEVLGKAKYSEKADVFSFGILLVELYSGRVPYSSNKFAALNQAQLMYRICSENARPEISDLPEPLRELVNDCWNLDPKLRPSFQEIIIRLRRLKHLRPESFSIDDSDASTPNPFNRILAEAEAQAMADSVTEDSFLLHHNPMSSRSRCHSDRIENIIGNLRTDSTTLSLELDCSDTEVGSVGSLSSNLSDAPPKRDHYSIQ